MAVWNLGSCTCTRGVQLGPAVAVGHRDAEGAAHAVLHQGHLATLDARQQPGDDRPGPPARRARGAGWRPAGGRAAGRGRRQAGTARPPRRVGRRARRDRGTRSVRSMSRSVMGCSSARPRSAAQDVGDPVAQGDRVGVGVEGGALGPEAEGVGVDQQRDPEGLRWPAGSEPRAGDSGGRRPASAVRSASNTRTEPPAPSGRSSSKRTARRSAGHGDPRPVGDVEAEERRHVEGLGVGLAAARHLRRVEHVPVALVPGRVGDLEHDHVERAAVGLVEVVDADGVEQPAQHPRLGEEPHRARREPGPGAPRPARPAPRARGGRCRRGSRCGGTRPGRAGAPTSPGARRSRRASRRGRRARSAAPGAARARPG